MGDSAMFEGGQIRRVPISSAGNYSLLLGMLASMMRRAVWVWAFALTNETGGR
jgi:hypothetical protein